MKTGGRDRRHEGEVVRMVLLLAILLRIVDHGERNNAVSVLQRSRLVPFFLPFFLFGVLNSPREAVGGASTLFYHVRSRKKSTHTG